MRHDELPRHVFGPVPGIVHTPHDLGLVAEVREIGPRRVKGDPLLLDLGPVDLRRGDDGLVPAIHQPAGEREVRVKITV